MSGLAAAPKQGSSAFVVKGDKILVGERISSHGAGTLYVSAPRSQLHD